jgi:hypothetical protein
MRVVDSTLRDLEGQDSRGTDGLAAMAGVLQLRAAVIAGRMKDPDQVEARLSEARGLAQRTGETAAYGVGWGPTNVGVHAFAIACDLEEYGQAVQLAPDFAGRPFRSVAVQPDTPSDRHAVTVSTPSVHGADHADQSLEVDTAERIRRQDRSDRHMVGRRQSVRDGWRARAQTPRRRVRRRHPGSVRPPLRATDGIR